MKISRTERSKFAQLKAEKERKGRRLHWIIGIYFLLSILTALLASSNQMSPWVPSELLSTIPTATTLTLHGELYRVITGYFFVMTIALPIVIASLLRAYPGSEWALCRFSGVLDPSLSSARPPSSLLGSLFYCRQLMLCELCACRHTCLKRCGITRHKNS